MVLNLWKNNPSTYSSHRPTVGGMLGMHEFLLHSLAIFSSRRVLLFKYIA